MSSDLNIRMTEVEAKNLWRFLSSREDELDYHLAGVRRKLESELWDRLSIEEMALAGTSPERTDV